MENLTIKEAANFASDYIGKKVTTSNISYLLNYGRIPKIGSNGNSLIKKNDLIDYYESHHGKREFEWKEKLGNDVDWHLSFDNLKESDTTKHVHRLHPYKGKFIPQLVEYFLDNHIDDFKKEIFFKKGDIILDPFCGSGTTLVQANELGIHAIGVDVSEFNCLISNVKIQNVNIENLQNTLNNISLKLKNFVSENNNLKFEEELLEELNVFNKKYFPSPEFKIKVRNKEINEREHVEKYELQSQLIFQKLISKFNIKITQNKKSRFLDIWYLVPVRKEIDFVFDEIKKIDDIQIKKIATIVLSRTIRSCRATTHADLATLLEPVTSTYYCSKHGKICKPLFTIQNWWERYTKDTIKRFSEFSKLRTGTEQICLNGNSENIDIENELEKKNKILFEIFKKKKIKGIFSSPPYVGLIDYHEQHAYAYDLFGFKRKDEEEIGPMFKRQSKIAQQEYAIGISNVLKNSKKYLAEDYDIFLVANDKYNLYPNIAENAGMKIVKQYKRPVLNRTEKDKNAYSEIIFHLKNK